MNSQMMKEQEQQMEDSLPECCYSVCDETKGGKEELTDDEVQQQQMEVCPQLENRKKFGTFFSSFFNKKKEKSWSFFYLYVYVLF